MSLEGLISNIAMKTLRDKQEEFLEDLDNLKQEVDQETKKLEETETEIGHWLLKLQNQSRNIGENPQLEAQYPDLSPSQTNEAAATATARAENTEGGAKLGFGREVEALGSGGLEYNINRRHHGPLKFPVISMSASDRAMAEAHIKSSVRRRKSEKSSVMKKKKKESEKSQSVKKKPKVLTKKKSGKSPPEENNSKKPKKRKLESDSDEEFIFSVDKKKSHQLQPHGFAYHVVDCSSKFETKPKLLQHLEDQHDIKHVKIDDKNSFQIPTERSPDNVHIAERALDWIK